MLSLKTLDEAERFVTRQQKLGSTVRWDGWDMVFFREAPQAVYSTDPEAVIRNGRYGFDNRVAVSDSGTWEIDYRNVRRSNRNRR